MDPVTHQPPSSPTSEKSSRVDPFDAELIESGFIGGAGIVGHLGFHVVVSLRRRFERAQLERAFEATLRDFPVLDCRFDEQLWRDRWVPVTDPVSSSVHMESLGTDADDEALEAVIARWAAAPHEPCAERPWRVIGVEGPGERFHIILSITHVVVDGGGAKAIAQAFGGHLYGVPHPVPVETRRSLSMTLERLSWWHAPLVLWGVLRESLRPMQVAMAPPRRDRFAMGYEGDLFWRELALSPEEFVRFKRACKAHGATVNDGLAAVLTHVSGERTEEGPASMVYTMDLRRYLKAPRLVAANISGLLWVVVPREALSDWSSLLSAVRGCTLEHRDRFAGMASMFFLSMVSNGWPRGLVRALMPRLLMGYLAPALSRALLMTNVGRLDDGASVYNEGEDVEEIRIVGPLVRGFETPVVAVYGWRGELRLHICGPEGMQPGAVESYLAQVRAALDDFIASSEGLA